MSLKQIRIGSGLNVIQYDDVDYSSAIETDQPMKAGVPVDPNDVLRKADNGTHTGDVVGPAVAVDSNLVEFDTASGKKIKDGSLSHTDTLDAINKKHSHTGVTQNITVVTNVVGPITAVLHFTNGILTSVT